MKNKSITHIHILSEDGADVKSIYQLLHSQIFSVLRNLSMVTAQSLYEELLRQGFYPVLDESGAEPSIWVIDSDLGMLRIHCSENSATVH